MNFMLLLLLLDNSLNISRLLKITAKKTNLGACCKNTIVHLYRQCKINENKLKT